MDNFFEMNIEDLKFALEELNKKYNKIKDRNLRLDMSRGKPSPEQLDLSNGLLNCISENDVAFYNKKAGFDIRNYGCLEGLPEMRQFMAELIGCNSDDVIIGGNSSLALMHDVITHFFISGIQNCEPWKNLEKIKFLCPSPGYDRHFKLCEYFGIEMIPIKMHQDGPDIEKIRNYVEHDESVKGIWCVPKFSNPQGITYSDKVVKILAGLRSAAKDFRILWDNAYCVHNFVQNKHNFNIFEECHKRENDEIIIAFCSTSKITFAGGGVAAIGCKGSNFVELKKYYSYKTIGFDKISQLRHLAFFGNSGEVLLKAIHKQMGKHALILKPKFDLAVNIFNKKFKNNPVIKWSEPEGGYFVSVETYGSAKRTVRLCLEAGLILTPAGVTFPANHDPDDSNIRIAPSYPNIRELECAIEIFCICAEISALERILAMR